MTLDEDKAIEKPESEQHAPGPKKEPDNCVKSPTGEHEWNRYPKPDNRHLGVCKYCPMQRIFPGALPQPSKALPPPPMPRGPYTYEFTNKPSEGEVFSSPIVPIGGQITEVKSITITPAKPDTDVKSKKVRRKQIKRTPAEKLKIIEEYRATKYGDRKKLLKQHGVSTSLFFYWEKHEVELRNEAGETLKTDTIKVKPPVKCAASAITYAERLEIIDEYRSGRLGDKAAICKKYDITKDTFDNWLKRQSYYRKVIERGVEAVHSETGKRTAILKKLRRLEDLSIEEAIGVLKDWRDIIHKDAVAARAKADELAERTTLTDIAIFKLVENAERSRQSIRESLKNMDCWNGIFGATK